MNRGFSSIGRLAARIAGFALLLAPASAQPVISEFMASNTRSLTDEDGAFSDWIELHNPTGEPVDLTGWALTDAANNKTKWQFPAVSLDPGAYLVVFASNKDRRDPASALHTNFALGKEGEYLGLIRPDGSVAHDYAPAFPAQADDVSYGVGLAEDGTARIGFFSTPTPGAPNGLSAAGQLTQSVAFSRPSGLFSDPALSIQLTGAAPGQQIRFTFAFGPGASLEDPTANSPLYDGPLTLTGTATIRAAVFSADGASRGPVVTAHYLKLDPALAGFTSRLPVLVLDNLGGGALEKDGLDHRGFLLGFRASTPSTPTFSAADVVTPLTTTVRGNTSAEFPKKSYNLALRDDRFQRRALPLFGFPAFDRWALVAPWSFDPSFVNNAFVYELSNRLGRWAPRTRLAEVFFNSDGNALDSSDYAGIYVLTDRIRLERGRVDLAELSASDNSAPAITGGYIFKIDPPDADELSWKTPRDLLSDPYTALVLVAPSAGDITPAQFDYLRGYVERMENALFADRAGGFAQRTYLDYIDRASWVDHHLLNVLVNNPDALHRSAYFHKNRGGRIAAGPVWDFDRALGTVWDDRTSLIDSWSGVGPSSVDVWRTGWWAILAQDPEFIQDWIDRWQSLRATQLSTANLSALFQSLANSIGPDAVARDVARWPDNASFHGDYTAQVDYVKDWLAQRTAWIDEQFVARPAVAVAGGTVTFTPPAGAVLVYTLDGSDPRSLGGKVAPNAELSAEPLTVPTSANVHVRAYDASRSQAAPSSPWSSAVATANANPLSPPARLANFSLRAHLESADTALSASLAVADSEAKSYLLRAIGPGLAAFGATNFAADPLLRVVDAQGQELQRNLGWQTHPEPTRLADLAKTVGAFPLAADSSDSALTHTHGLGSFTAHVAPGSPGAVLLELYPTDTYGRTSTLTTRALVRPGEPLIAGFVVQGPAYKRLLIRGLGPSLAANPSLSALELVVATGTRTLATNSAWFDAAGADTLVDAAARLGLAALSPDHPDAALLLTLPPGTYTVELRAQPEAAGIAQLEVHDVP